MTSLRTIGRISLLAAAAVLAVAQATGCGPAGEAAAKQPDDVVAVNELQEITISGKNYFFVAPDTIEAGWTTIRLRNMGPELHHVQLVRLADGKTVDDLMEALKQQQLPEWAELIGGPNAPQPRSESLGTLDLKPGNYAIICWIPTAEGVPHMAKGMSRAMTVVASKRPAVSAPTVDAGLVLEDYKFELTGELKAGSRTIKVQNDATQPHEVFIAKLEPGVSAEQFLVALEKGGPAAGIAVGGTTGIAPGGVNYITLQLEPGTYALYCFAPDAKDGKPHVAHGMMRELTVS